MPEDDMSKDTERPVRLEIKRASASDVPIVWEIIRESSKWLSDQGLNHWAKYYTEEMVAKMVHKKEVYMGIANGKTVGTVTLDTQPPKYYIEPGYSVRFTNPTDPAIYMTALAVLPEEQKQGFAGQLIQIVEDKAREKNIKWLRLDCRTEVPGLVSLYERKGFERLGDEPTDEGEDGTYWLMEKKLL